MTKPTRWRDVCAVPIDAAGGVPQVAHGASGSMAHTAPLLAALGLVTVLVGACGGSGAQAKSPPASTVTTSASTAASGTPVAPTPKQRAGVDAIRQVRRYERMLSSLAIHPRMSLHRLNLVSTEPDVYQQIHFLNGFREAKDRQTGYGRVSSSRVDTVLLPAPGGGRRYARVNVAICLDVRQVQGFGPQGQSIVPRSRKPYFRTHLVVVNRRYPKPSGWLVSRVTDHEQASCAV